METYSSHSVLFERFDLIKLLLLPEMVMQMLCCFLSQKMVFFFCHLVYPVGKSGLKVIEEAKK